MQDTITNPSEKVSRRDFLKITAVAGLSLGLGVASARRWLEKGDFVKITETHYLMGTVINFSVLASDKDQGQRAIQATRAEMERLITIFDHRNPNTQLAKLNSTGSLDQPSFELVALLQRALGISTLTSGAFDITVKPLVDALRDGEDDYLSLLELVDYRKILIKDAQIKFTQPNMSVTLDGIAKGHIVDGGVAVLRSLGFESVLVEAGGDMLASSDSVEKHDWKIGINNPRFTKKPDYIADFSINNQAVATSGDYVHHFSSDFSQHHIINPHSGFSPTQLSSVTVIAPSATEADALSTALMVLGVDDGLAFVEKLSGVEALFATKDQALYHSVGFPAI